MQPLTIFGTSSDAGKTTISMALCRLISDRGFRVAPFKAQNVSNNSAVTPEGREIARAQYFQAQAARVTPSYLFNPVLLKSYAGSAVQVIVNGLVHKNQTVSGYYDDLSELQQPVRQAFENLQTNYDLVIAEGAGSPVELNLLDKDLANTYIAKTFNTKNILVADIERGGVFAAIYGTIALLDPQLRDNLIGVVINKFRGDRKFFTDGERIIQERFGIPVLGVLPYMPLNIDMEDTLSLRNYNQRRDQVKIRVGVIAYPGLSNYNDLDPLMADPELDLEIIDNYRSLQTFDLIVLSGSKTVIADLRWLKSTGLLAEIKASGKAIFGLCGGYQMLCLRLYDPDALEHHEPTSEVGLGYINDEVVYQAPKLLTSGTYSIFGQDIAGYEIHYGRMASNPLFYTSETVCGTHIHGVFDDDNFRRHYFRTINPNYQGYCYADYRESQIQGFADQVGAIINIDNLLEKLVTTR
jgi:adenosylcobyric acid synthase